MGFLRIGNPDQWVIFLRQRCSDPGGGSPNPGCSLNPGGSSGCTHTPWDSVALSIGLAASLGLGAHSSCPGGHVAVA